MAAKLNPASACPPEMTSGEWREHKSSADALSEGFLNLFLSELRGIHFSPEALLPLSEDLATPLSREQALFLIKDIKTELLVRKCTVLERICLSAIATLVLAVAAIALLPLSKFFALATSVAAGTACVYTLVKYFESRSLSDYLSVVEVWISKCRELHPTIQLRFDPDFLKKFTPEPL